MARVWDQEKLDLLELYVSRGLAFSKIAKRLGVTGAAARGAYNRIKVEGSKHKKNPRHWNPWAISNLFIYVERGYSWERIGKIMRRSPTAIRDKYKRVRKERYKYGIGYVKVNDTGKYEARGKCWIYLGTFITEERAWLAVRLYGFWLKQGYENPPNTL